MKRLFSPDGRSLVYAEHSAGFPVMYALPLNEQYEPADAPSGLGQQGRAPAWSPDRRSVLFAYDDQGGRSFFALWECRCMGRRTADVL